MTMTDILFEVWISLGNEHPRNHPDLAAMRCVASFRARDVAEVKADLYGREGYLAEIREVRS